MTEAAWLDFINPVDVSTDPNANQGSIVGGVDALRTDDGDTSYVEVSNGYDQEEVDGYRDGGFSKTFQVDLEPDPTLPAAVSSWDIRFVCTQRVTTTTTTAVNVDRLLTTGREPIGSCTSLTYLEDFPRGSTVQGPTWDQLRTGGWQMSFRGEPRLLLAGYALTYLRITRLRLQVTFTLALSTVLPPLRQYPRTDGLGASSTRRVWPPPRSVQGSNRRVGGYS